MKKIFLFLICLLFTLSACSTNAPTQLIETVTHEPTPEPTATVLPSATPMPEKIQRFNLISDDPIVQHGESSDWDSRYTDPGAVIYHDGVFHMFRNGFQAFPATSQVGYVTSADGVTWEEQNNGEPIFKSEEVTYAKIAIYASSVIVEDDGTWVLYFYTWDSSSFPGSSVIGRATATDPNSTWVADVEPVLLFGASGEWDAQQVLAPHVIKTDDGYIMYYSGSDSKGKQQIGRATSDDGINWKKHNDPSTAQPFAESDPVFQSGDSKAWDSGWVHQPRVFQTANGWVMIYRGTKTVSGQSMAIGIATSVDGIQWERFTENSIFSHRQIKRAGYIWFHNALLVDDVYYLFIEGDINQTTHIYLATHAGELP